MAYLIEEHRCRAVSAEHILALASRETRAAEEEEEEAVEEEEEEEEASLKGKRNLSSVL